MEEADDDRHADTLDSLFFCSGQQQYSTLCGGSKSEQIGRIRSVLGGKKQGAAGGLFGFLR